MGMFEFEWVERARRANLGICVCVCVITRRVGCRDQTSEWGLRHTTYLDRVRRGVLDLGIETGDFADEHGLGGGRKWEWVRRLTLRA